MNENERLMMDVMAELMRANAPIIFKGAMNLNVALQDSSPVNVHRITHDIDGDWYGEDIDIEIMRNILENAVKKVNPDLSVEIFRNPAEGKSAGFRILDANQDRMFKVDFGHRVHPFYKDYQIMYQGQPVDIRGATLTKMLSDKIRAISSPKVFRRAKDLVDVYILSHCKKIALMDVYRMVYTDGHAPGTFDEFCHRRDDLKHAYEKLLNVENKPDFITMYKRLTAFLTPFINKRPQTLEWTGDKWASPQRIQENVRGLGR